MAAFEGGGGGAEVESQLGGALAVAGEAVGGEDGENVFFEAWRFGGEGREGEGEEGESHAIRSRTGFAPVTVTSDGVSTRPPYGYVTFW